MAAAANRGRGDEDSGLSQVKQRVENRLALNPETKFPLKKTLREGVALCFQLDVMTLDDVNEFLAQQDVTIAELNEQLAEQLEKHEKREAARREAERRDEEREAARREAERRDEKHKEEIKEIKLRQMLLKQQIANEGKQPLRPLSLPPLAPPPPSLTPLVPLPDLAAPPPPSSTTQPPPPLKEAAEAILRFEVSDKLLAAFRRVRPQEQFVAAVGRCSLMTLEEQRPMSDVLTDIQEAVRKTVEFPLSEASSRLARIAADLMVDGYFVDGPLKMGHRADHEFLLAWDSHSLKRCYIKLGPASTLKQEIWNIEVVYDHCKANKNRQAADVLIPKVLVSGAVPGNPDFHFFVIPRLSSVPRGVLKDRNGMDSFAQIAFGALCVIELLSLSNLAHCDVKETNLMWCPVPRGAQPKVYIGILIDYGGVTKIGLPCRERTPDTALDVPDFATTMRDRVCLAVALLNIINIDHQQTTVAGLRAFLKQLPGSCALHFIQHLLNPEVTFATLFTTLGMFGLPQEVIDLHITGAQH